MKRPAKAPERRQPGGSEKAYGAGRPRVRRRTLVLFGLLCVAIVASVFLRQLLQKPVVELRAMNESQLQGYLRQHSSHAEGWIVLGEYFLEEEQPERAAAALRNSLKLDPNSVHAAALWALSIGLTGEIMRAEGLLTDLDRQSAASTDAPLALGRLHQRAGNPNFAAKLYKRAVESDPNNSEAWYFKGLLEGGLGMFAAASTAFHKAQKLAPKVAKYYRAEADMSIHLNERENALRLATKALKMAPWDPKAHLVLGRALLLQNDPKLKKQGEAAMAKALDLVPGWLDPRLELAKLNLARNQTSVAINELEELVNDFPGHRECQYQLGQAYMRTGQTARGRKMMADYQKTIREENRYKEDELQSFAHPYNAELHRKVARYCVRNGAILGAAMHYRDLLRLKPKDAEAQQALKMLSGGMTSGS